MPDIQFAHCGALSAAGQGRKPWQMLAAVHTRGLFPGARQIQWTFVQRFEARRRDELQKHPDLISAAVVERFK